MRPNPGVEQMFPRSCAARWKVHPFDHMQFRSPTECINPISASRTVDTDADLVIATGRFGSLDSLRANPAFDGQTNPGRDAAQAGASHGFACVGSCCGVHKQVIDIATCRHALRWCDRGLMARVTAMARAFFTIVESAAEYDEEYIDYFEFTV